MENQKEHPYDYVKSLAKQRNIFFSCGALESAWRIVYF